MSEMQDIIVESATKIMEKYSTKEVINNSENGKWAGELWNNLVDYGMLGVAVSEELGGSGGDYSDALNILRLAGKYSAPIPLAENYLANWILSGLGENITDDIVTLDVSKKIQLLQFREKRDGWIVSGVVDQVPWARYAQKLLAFGESVEGPVLAILDLAHAEIIFKENIAGEARDKIIFNQIFFKDCKLIAVNHDEQMKKILYSGALMRSAQMTGALENILDLAITYTSERSQFGKPLHRFQAIQHHLAFLAGEMAASGTAINFAVNSYEKNPFDKEIALTKIRVNEAASKAAPIAHQVLAAIGFTYEHTLHHSTRRLWAWRDEFGTEPDWQKIITEELLKIEENGLWCLVTGVMNHTKKGQVK